MSDDDRSYFARRAQAEAERAVRAKHPSAAYAHAEMAKAYSARVVPSERENRFGA